VDDDRDLPAGDFSSWLSGMLAALRGERSSDVPCGTCTACCASSQFVHIGPDESDTLAHLPGELLFPAPRMPAGHVLLGYDERGRCPMLGDAGCSIYEHRPRACRTYDCRVLPAAGVDPDDKPLVADRVRRWRFAYPAPADRDRHAAVLAAASALADRPDLLPGGVAASATQRAVLAVEIHDTFLHRDEATGRTAVVAPEVDEVRVAVRRRTGGGEIT
jgi:hypothetical protein